MSRSATPISAIGIPFATHRPRSTVSVTVVPAMRPMGGFMPQLKRLTPVLEAIRKGCGCVIDGIALNSVTIDEHHGQPVAIKRRNLFGLCITPVANIFLELSHARVHMLVNVHDWQWREIMCFRKLNGHFDAVAPGFRTIREELLPGKSLWEHLKAGTLNRRMLCAAGTEFRRVHRLWSDLHQGPFSHGDAAMRNVVYDAEQNRARFIDFELVHNRDIPAIDRQSEDLASFLFDLVGLAPRRKWLPWAICFLESYGNETIIGELTHHLGAPRGLGQLWWRVRTNFADRSVILPRLERLRQALLRYQARRMRGPAPLSAISPASSVLPAIATQEFPARPRLIPVPA